MAANRCDVADESSAKISDILGCCFGLPTEFGSKNRGSSSIDVVADLSFLIPFSEDANHLIHSGFVTRLSSSAEAGKVNEGLLSLDEFAEFSFAIPFRIEPNRLIHSGFISRAPIDKV